MHDLYDENRTITLDVNQETCMFKDTIERWRRGKSVRYVLRISQNHGRTTGA